MGVREWLARRAAGTAHVLVVDVPGQVGLRAVVEQAVARRGWHLADSPAGADLLVVAGEVTESYEEPVGRTWDALAGPRAQVRVTDVDSVDDALEEACRQLLDGGRQARDARERMGFEGVEHHGDMDHGDMDHGDMDHGDMDHEGMDHEGMDHGGMDMAPYGIPLASGDPEDRDGLEMDSLPVRLGPVLAHWPAGLVLDVTLHGDLVVVARASWSGAGDAPAPTTTAGEPVRLAGAVVDVLALAGWPRGTAVARRLRDAVVEGRPERAATAAHELRRHLQRSRALRWALRGVGAVAADRAEALHLPAQVVGDAHTRLLGLVDRLAQHLPTGPDESDDLPVPVDGLAALVEGCDLAVARLVVASLGPWLLPVEACAHA